MIIQEEKHGCDECRKNVQTGRWLRIKVSAPGFGEHDSSWRKEIICCSWRCLRKQLAKIDGRAAPFIFVSLPQLLSLERVEALLKEWPSPEEGRVKKLEPERRDGGEK